MVTFIDPPERLIHLAETMEPKWRKRFLEVILTIRNSLTLEKIEELILTNNIEGAVMLAETSALKLGRLWAETFTLGGDDTAALVARALNISVGFDTVNQRAVNEMQANQLRLIRQFSEKQRIAVRYAMQDAIRRGLNPRQAARAFRGAIGLTSKQLEAVNNFRTMLEGNYQYARTFEASLKTALRRGLRDKRFDPTIARAILSKKPLTAAQIEKMVERYRSRYIIYRSQVIARTESLRAVHAGANNMYEQSFESGILRRDSLTRTWDTSSDSRVRASHRPMEGQQRQVGEAFVTGLGNLMMYPGDPSAPAADSVQDRCAVLTRYAD